jgi:hypothetical protein
MEEKYLKEILQQQKRRGKDSGVLNNPKMEAFIREN